MNKLATDFPTFFGRLLLFSPTIIGAFLVIPLFWELHTDPECWSEESAPLAGALMLLMIGYVVLTTIVQIIVIGIRQAVMAYGRNKEERPAAYSKIGIASSIFVVGPLIILFLIKFGPRVWDPFDRPGVMMGLIGALIGFVGLIEGVFRSKKIVFAALGILFNGWCIWGIMFY